MLSEKTTADLRAAAQAAFDAIDDLMVVADRARDEARSAEQAFLREHCTRAWSSDEEDQWTDHEDWRDDLIACIRMLEEASCAAQALSRLRRGPLADVGGERDGQ